MGDGVLSQDEINALLGGMTADADASASTEAPAADTSADAGDFHSVRKYREETALPP